MESYFFGLPFWAKSCFIMVFITWAIYSYIGQKEKNRYFFYSSRGLIVWALVVVWLPSDMLPNSLLFTIVFLSCIPVILFPLFSLLSINAKKENGGRPVVGTKKDAR